MGKVRFIRKFIRGRIRTIPVLDKGKVQKPLPSIGSRIDEVRNIRKSARTQAMSAGAKKFSMTRASALGKKIDTVLKDILRRNRPPKTRPSKQVRRATTKKKQLAAMDKKIEKEFGFTSDPREAGFIDRKGRMIDLSGKNIGGPGGYRARDHREIEQVFESPKVKADAMGTRSQNLFEYMHEAKSIRISDHGNVLNLDFAGRPTMEQLKQIIKISQDRAVIYADLTDTKGNVIRSGEFQTIDEVIRALFRKK